MLKQPSISTLTTSNSATSFVSLLERMIENRPSGDCRREFARIPRSLVLQIQPLNSNFEREGESFRATTRDVSRKGLGFLHETEFEWPYIEIGPNSHSACQSIARVCYNVTFFGMEALYLIGVQFLTAEEVQQIQANPSTTV